MFIHHFCWWQLVSEVCWDNGKKWEPNWRSEELAAFFYIMISVDADNKAGVACYKQVGFRECGWWREWIAKDG